MSGMGYSKRNELNVKRNTMRLREWHIAVGWLFPSIKSRNLGDTHDPFHVSLILNYVQHYSIIEICLPLNRLPMCVRHLEMIMTIILKKKNVSRGSCSGTQDIEYLKERACIIMIIIIFTAIMPLPIGIIFPVCKQSFLALIIRSNTCVRGFLNFSNFRRQQII